MAEARAAEASRKLQELEDVRERADWLARRVAELEAELRARSASEEALRLSHSEMLVELEQRRRKEDKTKEDLRSETEAREAAEHNAQRLLQEKSARRHAEAETRAQHEAQLQVRARARERGSAGARAAAPSSKKQPPPCLPRLVLSPLVQ